MNMKPDCATFEVMKIRLYKHIKYYVTVICPDYHTPQGYFRKLKKNCSIIDDENNSMTCI